MDIKEALKILADTKENQLAYLISIGTSPSTDELALQFIDTYQVFKGKLDEEFDEKVFKNLDVISSLFDNMSNIPNNAFWKVSSLDSTEWAKVRGLAKETLQIMSHLKG